MSDKWERKLIYFKGAKCEICERDVPRRNDALVRVEEVNEFRGDDAVHVRHMSCHRRAEREQGK